MKLIFCRRCGDVRALRSAKWTSCYCGRTKGKYRADGIHAIVKGQNPIAIGFANWSFNGALIREKDDEAIGTKKDQGHLFDAFVIPWNSSTVQRIDTSRQMVLPNATLPGQDQKLDVSKPGTDEPSAVTCRKRT
jgi:hypothetical protein